MERMDVWLGEATEPTGLLVPQSANFHAVTNIDHDTKGQRTLIEYGNGAKTAYTYDEKTFRLIHLKTTRGGAVLQDLFYTYDPVGNITRIRDDAQQAIFFNNQVVVPHCDYTYDPIYRLIEAAGWEHIGQAGQPETSWDDEFRVNLPHPNDIQAMRDYSEEYKYDAVGNILNFIHNVNSTKLWERRYNYEASNNRLLSTTVPGIPSQPELLVNYEYDAHGNMIRMPHLTEMMWDYGDRLQMTQQQVVNNGGTAERTYYIYDASSQRVRKVTEKQAAVGVTPTKKNERLYLGGYEIYREYNGDGTTVILERETLHVMDDKRRIALVETKTIGNDSTPLLVPVIRYQLDNHLGSASVELDKDGKAISYEEYYPYGSTSYQGTSGVAEVSRKRYRYTGKERNEETGLYYHGARYYVPWLGRWTSCDPIFLIRRHNLYVYVGNSPIVLIDLSGQSETSFDLDGQEINISGDGEYKRKSFKLDVDEKTAVKGSKAGGQSGSPTAAGNKQFLDSTTNSRTKSNFASKNPQSPKRNISLADAKASGSLKEAGEQMLVSDFDQTDELNKLTSDIEKRQVDN